VGAATRSRIERSDGVPFPSSSGSITAAPSVSGKISSPGTIVPGCASACSSAARSIRYCQIASWSDRSVTSDASIPSRTSGQAVAASRAARAAVTAASSFGGNSATSVAGACETPSKTAPSDSKIPPTSCSTS